MKFVILWLKIMNLAPEQSNDIAGCIAMAKVAMNNNQISQKTFHILHSRAKTSYGMFIVSIT